MLSSWNVPGRHFSQVALVLGTLQIFDWVPHGQSTAMQWRVTGGYREVSWCGTGCELEADVMCQALHSSSVSRKWPIDDTYSTDTTETHMRHSFPGIGYLSELILDIHYWCTDDRSIIGIGRLSAVLTIIVIGRLVRWYRPIVVFALCGLHVTEIKFTYA